jgi:hypothetical protein
MEVRIAGPLTPDEIPRYRMAAMILESFEEGVVEGQEKLATMPEGPEAEEVRHKISEYQENAKQLRRYFGPREERTKDPIVREVEELIGMPFDWDEDDEEGA